MPSPAEAPNDNQEPGPVAPPRPGFFAFSLRWRSLLAALLVAACLPTWLGFAARWHWLLELTTHFAWQYAVAMPVVVLLAFAAKRRRVAWLAGATLLVNLYALSGYGVADIREDAWGEKLARRSFRVMTLNVLTANRRFDDVLQLVEREQPDVMVFLEVDQPWVDALEALETKYLTHDAVVRTDNFGVAFFSRLPVDSLAFQDFGADVPSVVAEVQTPRGPVVFVGTHPLPPSSRLFAELRNRQLSALASYVAELPAPTIVAGDLNITPFSPYFRDLLRVGNLVDSAVGVPYKATWFGGGRFMAIPIDHVLHTSGLLTWKHRVSGPIGSDHRAVLVDFVLAPGD